jgi:hypothetical protein
MAAGSSIIDGTVPSGTGVVLWQQGAVVTILFSSSRHPWSVQSSWFWDEGNWADCLADGP